MKLNIKIATLFIALSAILMQSCIDEFLDKKPYGTSSFWTSDQEAVLGINAVYAPLYEEEFYGRGQFWIESADDDMTINNSGKTATIALTNFTATSNDDSYSRTYWDFCYVVIRRANDVLSNVPAISMDSVKRNRILGEANFMLGFTYFQLARRHGGVPFADMAHPTDPGNLNKPRETKTNTYKNIEQYLKNAVQLLPEAQENDDYGRPNKYAAYGMLAKVYAYWGKYPEAKDACEQVISSGRFNLLDEYRKVFSLNYEKSPEHIFFLSGKAARHQSTITSVVCMSKKFTAGAGWKYFSPTKSLYNAFEPGDTRRKNTLVGAGDTVRFTGKNTILTKDTISDMETGYMCIKYAQPYQESAGYDWETGLDIPILRYSDVLLLHAEAIMMLNGGGPDQSKRNIEIAAAAESFNKVRVRAFNGDNSYAIAAPTFMDLVNERRREFAYEEQRHPDLVRWGLAKEVYASATKDTDPRGPRTFDPAKDNCFMIPQTVIDMGNGMIINNPAPGYSTFE